jgi:AcrR family transcriptional regulator
MAEVALRADARRNRDTLLESAAEAFAEHGVDTSLEDIARRSGVGIGTLYRHFPSRESLVIATYERGVTLLCDGAAELLAVHPDDPDKALEEWMDRYVAYVATKRGLASTLKAAMEGNDELFAGFRERVYAAADSLLSAAVSAGRIRPDIEGADLLRALGGICMVSDSEGWREQSRRLVKLLLDGLRYGAPA